MTRPEGLEFVLLMGRADKRRLAGTEEGWSVGGFTVKCSVIADCSQWPSVCLAVVSVSPLSLSPTLLLTSVVLGSSCISVLPDLTVCLSAAS